MITRKTIANIDLIWFCVTGACLVVAVLLVFYPNGWSKSPREPFQLKFKDGKLLNCEVYEITQCGLNLSSCGDGNSYYCLRNVIRTHK